jgi:hypothetical protein
MRQAVCRRPRRARGPWYAVVLVASSWACARGDVTSYLQSGACNAEGHCADGYQCDLGTWQCIKHDSPADAAVGMPDVGIPDVGIPDASADEMPSCDNGGTFCNGECVDTRTDPAHCGSCASTCHGVGSQLVCGHVAPGICDCAGNDVLCGGLGTASACEASSGRCVCGGRTCATGEICRGDSSGASVCSCDQVQTCSPGLTCCQGVGCVELRQRADHCGACGRPCPKTFACEGGICLCKNQGACQAKGEGSCNADGRCQCGGVVCDPGKICIATGVCG